MNQTDISSIDTARSWLNWLYGEKFEGNLWIGGHRNWRGERFTDVDEAVTYALALDAGGQGLDGVYHRLTTVNDAAKKRGTDEDSVSLPALMLDLDIRGPGHKSASLPEGFEQLWEILSAVGLPEPSAWVNSGGGRYPVWKLAEPARIDFVHDEAGAESIRATPRLLAGAVKAEAKSRGLKLDNTSDLARVYRLPGTTNRKGEMPVTAAWALGSGQTYELAELAAILDRYATPVTVEPEPASSLFAEQWGESSLFAPGGGFPAGDERAFTVASAMAFVAPALEALRTAEDGEINVRLNEAACVLAHFGPEFWDEAAADAQLERALANTAYDGVTWKAHDTIASARRAMASDWRATLITPAPDASMLESAVAAAPADEVDALLAEMLSLDELETAPPPKFMIHKFLQFDSESWIIGLPGSKKSFVAFDMAARVVRGEPWQGHRTNPADVVFIVAEGASGHGKRVKAFRTKYGRVDGTGDEQRVFTLPRPVQAKDVAQWGVLARACGRLAERARARGRGLMVVIDTQARVTVGLSENDNGEMNHYVEAVSVIRRATAACVLTIHHTGKDGRTSRGGSVVDGAQTTELKVESASGKLTGRILTEKQKDIDEAKPLDVAFEVVYVGQDEDGEAVTSLVLAEAGSVAFRAAWAGAEAGGEEVDVREQETPFKHRIELEPWIAARRPARGQAPVHEWWIVQALVDTAETLGLSQVDVRDIVVEKRGAIDKTTFKRAWQAATAEDGRWTDILTAAGGGRWTVDRLAVESARTSSATTP